MVNYTFFLLDFQVIHAAKEANLALLVPFPKVFSLLQPYYSQSQHVTLREEGIE